MNTQRRMDDNDTLLFFERELESIKSKSYGVKYADLSYSTLFPMSSDAGRGKSQITYYQLDGVALAKIYNGNSKDIPIVNLKRKRFTSDVRHLVTGYTYSVFDVESAALANLPLDSKLAGFALMPSISTTISSKPCLCSSNGI